MSPGFCACRLYWLQKLIARSFCNPRDCLTLCFVQMLFTQYGINQLDNTWPRATRYAASSLHDLLCWKPVTCTLSTLWLDLFPLAVEQVRLRNACSALCKRSRHACSCDRLKATVNPLSACQPASTRSQAAGHSHEASHVAERVVFAERGEANKSSMDAKQI